MDDAQIKQVAGLLGKLETGFLPYLIFEQVARLVALPILEFIPLRRAEGETEVLLLKRPAEDPLWPGALHTPGTVIRATDLHTGEQENWSAFERILHDELKGTALGKPQYVGSMLHKSKRGVEQAQLYWVEVIGEPQVGTFFPVRRLPERLIDSQYKFIAEAVRHFERETA
jgi:hypothetical protein